MRKLVLFLAVFVVVVSLTLASKIHNASGQFIPLVQTIDADVIGDVTLYQFFQDSKPLEGMLVSVPLNQTLDDPLTFTIYLDVNDDGTFHQNEMVVDGMPAPVEVELSNVFPVLPHSKNIAQKLLALPDGATLNIKILLNDSSGDEIATERQATKMHFDIGEIFDPAPGFVGGIRKKELGIRNYELGSTLPISLHTVLAQSGKKDPSNVPVNHTGVDDLGGRSGKPNECVPLSFANSLLWLAKTHGFGSKMPGTDDALIDELASDMKWTKDGTKHENILPGKEAFTKRRGLQLTNKKIDNEVVNGESQLWKRIVSELNDGEDVELILDFKQSPRGAATKGHAVTVTGADKTKKGKQTVTFHDPATPKGSETYEMDRNSQIVGYPFGKAYGTFIVSESFNGPSVTPSPSPSTTPSLEPSHTPTPSTIPSGTPTPTDTPQPTGTSPTPDLFPSP